MNSKMSNKKQIFISYSHSDADQKWIKAFAESLQRGGFSVWLDEWRVRAGESLPESIEDGLRSSDIIASLITSQSVKQPSLFFELGAAVSMGKRVVAIVSNDVEYSQLPQSLRTRKFLRRASPEETANQLLSETQSMLSDEEMPETVPVA
jgi:hypothetical protein